MDGEVEVAGQGACPGPASEDARRDSARRAGWEGRAGGLNGAALLATVGIHLRDTHVGEHRLRCHWCTKNKPGSVPLKVTVKPDGHARWICFRCGTSGDTYKIARDLEREERRWRQRASLAPSQPRQAARSRAPAQVPPQRNDACDEPLLAEHEGKRHKPYTAEHAAFWDSLEPITVSDPVGRYLTGRGCPIPAEGADLRWHPDWAHHHRNVPWRGPCMIGRITHALTAEALSFHFTWLAKDGSAKAPIDAPRLMAKNMQKQHGVVRLTDDADAGSWLMTGEGLETCLAAYGRAQARWNVWAAIDAGNLERLPYVDGIDRLLILADRDAPNRQTGRAAGTAAAARLAAAWHRASRGSLSIDILIGREPPVDANDLVRTTLAGERAA